jgi:hypothetical protein
MSSPPSDENGAHVRAINGLMARAALQLGESPEFDALQVMHRQVRSKYGMAVARASQSCRLQPICSVDEGKLFRLTLASANIEADLLAVTAGLLALIDQRARRDVPAGARASRDDSASRALVMLKRVVSTLHGNIQRTALGESRSARGAALADIDGDVCDDCGVALVVHAARSEKSCPRCARVYPIFGIVFDDAQLLQQEGQRGKSGCFSPSSHYDEWMRNILAQESDELLCKKGTEESPGDVIRLLGEQARLRNKLLPLLTIEGLRVLLKAIKRTDLNAHSSLIMRKLTGRGPPDISKERQVKAASMFTRVLSVRDALTRNTGNRHYYPYYTIKIFDLILPKGDPDRALFRYIHMQSVETLHKNDIEWSKICAELGWEYRATDPAMLL